MQIAVVKKEHEKIPFGSRKTNLNCSSVFCLENLLPSSSLENFQQSLNIMLGGFMRKEPLNSTKLHEHPKVVALFTRANWMPFFERIHGYEEEVTEEILMFLRPHSKTHATVSFRGLTIELTPEFISRITGLPLKLPWSKEEKPLGQVAKKTFFQHDEHLVEDKNGV